MKMKYLLIIFALAMNGVLLGQTSYYGMTSQGGESNAGTIFKTDLNGSNLQTVFNFKYHHAGRTPKSVFTQAANGKIYGTTQFGGANVCSFPYYQYQKYSGVIFEYDTTNDNYTVLFNFDDTTTGCWPTSAPVLASNGKLYGVTPGIGGFSQHYGTVYSYDLATGTYTKIHSFGQGSDGENPVGNLLLATDGKLYGITSDGGFNDKGVIFTIDPATDTYTKKLDLQDGWYGNKAAQDARSGLIQAPNGKMYGTSESGGNYPNGYQYAYGNIFEYNPTTNVATNLFGFSDGGLGKNPEGAPVLVGTNYLYCITHKYYQVPGTYNYLPHYYLWKYSISTGTALVVDSIANGMINSKLTVNASGKIIFTGHDYNISSATRFWEFNPSTNTRTLIDTNANLRYFYKGLMLASNGKYYAGGAYPDANNPLSTNGDGSFVEYDASNHTVTEKFKFSEPIDGINPEGDLIMATNGKFYGMTSKGGTYNKGIVFEFNPSNDTFIKKFDLDSFSGYEPKAGLMEASNGKFYGLTYRGGNNGSGAVFEIDTTTWTLTKKADFGSSMIKPMGRLVEAWDGKLYGLTAWNGGTVFQYDITTATLTNKHTFTTNDGSAPQGSLAIANNGKLYGTTSYGGQSYYSHGTLFEYDPATSTFTMKKELYNYTGYHSQGNTPTLGTDGKMYVMLTTGGNGNTEYVGGAINEYIPGATSLTNKASFSVSNTGSKPMGDLMESVNGKFYGYTWTGGANSKGTVFEYNPSTAVLTKKVDFNGTNGALPVHGSLTESNTAAISISQQPMISGVCVGDTAYLSIAASHSTLLHYQWYKNGSRIAGATNDTIVFYGITAADAGNFYCKVTGGTRAVVSTTYTFAPSPKPTVSITGLANAYCLDYANVNLSANPSGGSFSGTGVTGTVFSPATAGVGNHDVIYSYTNTQGCFNTDTVSVTINALPNAGFSGYALSYCDNSLTDTMIANTTGGSFTGLGMTGNIFDPSFYASSPGLVIFNKIKYTITDANNCTNVDSVVVSVYHAPIVTLSGLDATYCSNDAFDTLVTSPTGGTLTAGSFISGSIFNPANAAIGTNDIYYEYTNSNNCTNFDTLHILVNAAPDASFTGLDANYCNNAMADTLIATTSGGTFSGSVVNGNIFDPNQITIPGGSLFVLKHVYYTITDNNSCTSMDTLSTTVYPLPTVSFGPLAAAFCDNDVSVILNAGTPNGGTYTGSGIMGLAFTPANANLGLDTLVYSYTNTNNCTNMDTAYTTVFPAPDFTLGNDTNMCINHTMTLSTGLGSAYVYLWSDGSTSATFTIDAATIGVGTHIFSVIVKNSQTNCEETDEIEVTVDACTGINEQEENNDALTVFPNPSKGQFSIESDVQIDQIEVYSAEGKLVYTQKLGSNMQSAKLNLSNEVPGIYHLLIISGNKVVRKKLIVQR